MRAALVFIVLHCVFLSAVMSYGTPRIPGGKGKGVVARVSTEIKEANIFTPADDDHRFLCRVALLESKYGDAPRTYRANYNGGIWQVNKATYDTTTSLVGPKARTIYEKIKTTFHIDWKATTWKDLRIPLYSGLAARIFIDTFPDPIPKDVRAQGEYWKKYYNLSGVVDTFIKDVKHSSGCADP